MAIDVNLWHTYHKGGVVTKAPHEGQQKLMESDARFKVVVCGRRWGKSFFSVVHILSEALANPNSLYWYIGPTYRQAKNIAWRMLMSRIKLFPKWWQDKVHIEKNNLIVELPNGSIIELKGAQDPDALVGSGLDGVVLDEYAVDTYGQSPVWKKAIRPSLSDKQGWAIFISTPKGYNHFYQIYNFAEEDETGEWESFRMPTSTNPYITKKELKSARAEVGDDMFSQEYEADFRKRSGLVYKEFDRDIHVIDNLEPNDIESKWSLEIGIDFGSAHPTAALYVMFDHVHDIAYVVDEYYESEKTTEQNISAIKAKEDFWLQPLGRRRPRRIGDSQAKQTIMDYSARGYNITPTLKGADSVDNGIAEVRKRLLKDLVTGSPKLYICRRCTNTILEFENYTWKGFKDDTIQTDEIMKLATKGQDGPRKIFDDAMDALRYVLQYHSPIYSGESSVRRVRRVRNPITGV